MYLGATLQSAAAIGMHQESLRVIDMQGRKTHNEVNNPSEGSNS
jgi:hypothetical protein